MLVWKDKDSKTWTGQGREDLREKKILKCLGNTCCKGGIKKLVGIGKWEKVITLLTRVCRRVRYGILKRRSLFAAWLFWTFHTKSHNMKALVILSNSWSPFLPLTCLYGKKLTFVGLCTAFWSIFWEKLPSDYPCKSHDHDHQWAVLVMLNLCLFTFYSVHANESIVYKKTRYPPNER